MYYLTGTSVVRIDQQDLGLLVTARTVHADRVIQCYVRGDLAAWQCPQEGTVSFVLQEGRAEDPILLLAVDPADARRSYWAEVMEQAGPLRRIRVRTLRRMSYAPGDRWRVYLGPAGGGEADELVCELPFYEGGRRCGGWGFVWGEGGWGHGGHDAAGWGNNWGHEWGFNADELEWTSQPLARGTYPVKVTVADACGNESAPWEGLAAVSTPPRPAAALAVQSYDKTTGRLVLSFKPSQDVG